MGARAIPGDHDGLAVGTSTRWSTSTSRRSAARRAQPRRHPGAFTPIRDWFAGLPEAKARGYGPSRFSFNVKGGRCEACQGDGVIKIEMHFLPDVFVTCDVCKGKRFNRETLEVTYRARSIADVLDALVDQAVEFFEAVPPVRNKLVTLHQVGLGYIHRPAGDHHALGQRGTAGEARQGAQPRRATGRTRSTSSTSRPRACASRT